MKDITSRLFYRDGTFYRAEELPARCFENDVIYEVIRFMDGKPLFLHDHLNRLISSARKAEYRIPDIRKLKEGIRLFSRRVDLTEGNIKTLLCFDKEKSSFSVYVYQVHHRYPTGEDYETGVVVATESMERTEPNVKKWNPEMRQKTERLKGEKDIYEVLMVDSKGNITEGSKSNIFMIMGDSLVTPPDEVVLPGITRKKVIALCFDLKIPVRFENLPYQNLTSYSGAFLSGTSPKILPLRKIDNHTFDVSQPLIKKLMNAYDQLIMKELQKSPF